MASSAPKRSAEQPTESQERSSAPKRSADQGAEGHESKKVRVTKPLDENISEEDKLKEAFLGSAQKLCLNTPMVFLHKATHAAQDLAQEIMQDLKKTNNIKMDLKKTTSMIQDLKQTYNQQFKAPIHSFIPNALFDETQAMAFSIISGMFVHRMVFEEMDLMNLCCSSGLVPIPVEMSLSSNPSSMLATLTALQSTLWMAGRDGKLERGRSTIRSIINKFEGAVIDGVNPDPEGKTQGLVNKLLEVRQEQFNKSADQVKSLIEAAKRDQEITAIMRKVPGRLQATAHQMSTEMMQHLDEALRLNALQGVKENKELSADILKYYPVTFRQIQALASRPAVASGDDVLTQVAQGHYAWDTWADPEKREKALELEDDEASQLQIENVFEHAAAEYARRNKKRTALERQLEAAKRNGKDDEIEALQIKFDAADEQVNQAMKLLNEARNDMKSAGVVALAKGRKKLAQTKKVKDEILQDVYGQNSDPVWIEKKAGFPLGTYKSFIGGSALAEQCEHAESARTQGYGASASGGFLCWGASASVQASSGSNQAKTEAMAAAAKSTCLCTFEAEHFMLHNPAVTDLLDVLPQSDFYIPGIQPGEFWSEDGYQAQYVVDSVVVCQKLAVKTASEFVIATIQEEATSTSSSLEASASVSVPFVSASANYSASGSSARGGESTQAQADVKEKTILKPNPHVKFILFKKLPAAPMRGEDGAGITAESLGCKRYMSCDPLLVEVANKEANALREKKKAERQQRARELEAKEKKR